VVTLRFPVACCAALVPRSASAGLPLAPPRASRCGPRAHCRASRGGGPLYPASRARPGLCASCLMGPAQRFCRARVAMGGPHSVPTARRLPLCLRSSFALCALGSRPLPSFVAAVVLSRTARPPPRASSILLDSLPPAVHAPPRVLPRGGVLQGRQAPRAAPPHSPGSAPHRRCQAHRPPGAPGRLGAGAGWPCVTSPRPGLGVA